MSNNKPLAERMRPKTLSQFIGQQHLLGESAVLTQSLRSKSIPSLILWGPPGVGKTTLANILASEIGCPFYVLSAINSGVKDVREVIERAEKDILLQEKPILFIDEIHRFSKSQQDSLLGAVEKGTIILIGATTENPSFEVIKPLLSRCRVYTLNELTKEELIAIIQQAIEQDEVLKQKDIEIQEYEALLRYSGGDARRLLNTFELIVNAEPSNKVVITNENVLLFAQQNMALYDKTGEQHYDIISAFIKSIRGSDPNAAVYWLARMIKGGEDPLFIARRLLILASEDIGNANPTALVIANSCFQAVEVIGYPECRIILSQAVTYLASSPKSNAAYEAINNAQELVNKTGDLSVPLHIRNAPTKLMRDLGYGKEYKYSHNYEQNFIDQEFMPNEISGTTLYSPGSNSREQELRNFLKAHWKTKYKY